MSSPRSGYRVCQRCGRNRAERFFQPRGAVCSNCKKQTAARSSKDARLKETYGISYDEWTKIMAMQGGVCAICKGKRSSWDVDHSHSRERALRESGVDPLEATRLSVRGLLCRRCNRRLLPAALDSPDVLDSAKAYLAEPPAHLVILT